MSANGDFSSCQADFAATYRHLSNIPQVRFPEPQIDFDKNGQMRSSLSKMLLKQFTALNEQGRE